VGEAPAEQVDNRMCFIVSRTVLVAIPARFQEPSRKVPEEERWQNLGIIFPVLAKQCCSSGRLPC